MSNIIDFDKVIQDPIRRALLIKKFAMCLATITGTPIDIVKNTLEAEKAEATMQERDARLSDETRARMEEMIGKDAADSNSSEANRQAHIRAIEAIIELRPALTEAFRKHRLEDFFLWTKEGDI